LREAGPELSVVPRRPVAFDEVDDDDDDDEKEGELPGSKGLWDEPRKGRAEREPKNHLWRTFVKRAFVGTRPDEELEDRFG